MTAGMELLHTGLGHPDLTLLVLTAILSFLAGTGTGAYATLKGKLSSPTDAESADG